MNRSLNCCNFSITMFCFSHSHDVLFVCFPPRLFLRAVILRLTQFDDSGTPPMGVVSEFMRVARESSGLVAVHCKTGLGRTGTLVAAYLMRYHGFTAREAMGWLRIMRPGSVMGEQQRFLCSLEAPSAEIAPSASPLPRAGSGPTRLDEEGWEQEPGPGRAGAERGLTGRVCFAGRDTAAALSDQVGSPVALPRQNPSPTALPAPPRLPCTLNHKRTQAHSSSTRAQRSSQTKTRKHARTHTK